MIIRLFYSLLFFTCVNFFYSQEIPNISLQTLDGEKLNISQIDTSSPVILVFWATWCLPCMEELTNINEKYDEWQKEEKFTIYAVSTDDSRTSSKVKSIVKSRGWPYHILLDQNQSLKRSLNINSIPYLIVLHHDKVVYSHIGYALGDEDDLFTKIKACYKNF